MTATLKRCTMTDDGDFYDYFCEKCDHGMGGNGPDPYVHTSDDEILCVVCALREGVKKTALVLDPETTTERKDTVESVLMAGVWDYSYLTGLRAAQEDPEYQEAQRRWFNLGRAGNGEPLEGEGVWDEDTEGPFWRWCNQHHRPFLMAAFKSLCDQPHVRGDCRALIHPSPLHRSR